MVTLSKQRQQLSFNQQRQFTQSNSLVMFLDLAFKATNLNLMSQLEQCDEDQLVLMVVMRGATDLPASESFIRMNVVEPIREFDQIQRTSQITGSNNPVWGETEQFFFIVSDDSRILFQATRNYRMNAKVAQFIGKTKYLGNVILPVADVTPEFKSFDLPLWDPDTNEPNGAKVQFSAQLIPREQAMNTRLEICFEYQRYSTKWSMAADDPCRFSNWNNTRFGSSFGEVTEDLEDGWSVVSGWTTNANEHGEGWMYAMDMLSNDWMMSKGPKALIRRKVWSRFVARDDFAEDINVKDDEDKEREEREKAERESTKPVEGTVFNAPSRKNINGR
jgi:hypothetical protein